jgi:hypothetical protein
VFCLVTGCWFWNWLGGFYRGEDQNRAAQVITEFAQLTGCRLHNSRLYWWLDKS